MIDDIRVRRSVEMAIEELKRRRGRKRVEAVNEGSGIDESMKCEHQDERQVR